MIQAQPEVFLHAKESLIDSQIPDQSANEDTEDQNMLNSKLRLTTIERVFLELIMLTPIAIVFAALYTTHSFVLTLFLFHVTLTTFSLLFLKKKNVNINWRSLLQQDLAKNTRNLMDDVKLIALPALLLTCVYVVYRILFPGYPYEKLRLPSVNDHFAAVILVIEFVIINPIVEELFWRFFTHLFTGRGKTFLNKLDACFHFGCYHWFVSYYLTQDALLSTAGFLGVMSLGFILSYVKEKFGLITAMILHVGVDLSLVIVVVDIQTHFIPFY